MKTADDPLWRGVKRAPERGDISDLEPMFDEDRSAEGNTCRIIDFYEEGILRTSGKRWRKL